MSVLERTEMHHDVQVLGMFALMGWTAFQSAFIISGEPNSNRQLIGMEIEYIIFSLRCGLDYFGTTSSKLKLSLFAYLYMVRKDAASTDPPFSWDRNNISVPVMLTLICIIWSHGVVQLYQKHELTNFSNDITNLKSLSKQILIIFQTCPFL